MTDLSAIAPPPVEDCEINTPDMLHKELLYFIRDAIANHPRSQQERIGPSEIGTPCVRKLGYKLANTPPVNLATGDGWRATVGTATHAWLADMLVQANLKLDEERFLIEERITPGTIDGDPLDGSCDCYDRLTQTVVDWKIVGPTSLKRIRSNGFSQTYRTQVHTYGLGWTRRGMRVKNVAIYALPSAGDLAQGVFWSEPYNETVATQAIRRANDVAELLRDNGPSVLSLLPTADDYCNYCPYYRPGVTAGVVACPGDPSRRQTGDSFTGLIP